LPPPEMLLQLQVHSKNGFSFLFSTGADS